jgi:VIT1/CCC1 family predicted Fe2+/Mn2+ transporter
MKPVLDPVERVSEIIFGVLMAMTFIGALSVADSGREDVRTAMIAALGCNLAWGLADAVMYIVGTLTERTKEGTRLVFDDYRGALGVFLLVALSTFPLVVPFLVFNQLKPALLASRLVALVMLFIGGWMLARHAGGKPWRWGFGLAAVGAVLLGAIMALGG